MKSVILSLVLACLGSGCHHCRKVESSAYFEVGFTNTKEKFVIKLVSPERIEEARRLTSVPPDVAPHISGIIVKGQESYNPQWRFHLEPGSIEFVSQSMELCDATIRFVDDHLDEAASLFPPGARWCPWRSRVLREVRGTDLRAAARVREDAAVQDGGKVRNAND